MNEFYTYLHCTPDGFPFYVGKGKGNRSIDFRRSRSSWHKGIVKKYGKDNIKVYVFYCESEDQAFKDEIQQIAQLRSLGYKLCNLTNGGDGTSGYRPNEETRKKLSESRIGHIVSEETRKKLSASNRGKPRSEEARKKMSKAKIGSKRSPETCAKIAKSMTGRQVSDEFRLKMSMIRRATIAKKKLGE